MKIRITIIFLTLAYVANASVSGAAGGEAPGAAKLPWEDLRADLERRVGLEVEAARRISEAEEHYRLGVQLLRRSRRSEALDHFRQAESSILDAGEEAYMASSLQNYLHRLRSRIAAEGAADPAKPASGPVPEDLVEGATLRWLAAAVRRPISEEPALRAIFRTERVPEELIYVGLVESGYRRDAISRAGAAGPWQFIDETGRRYGLSRGKDGDDRRNLLKSTRAAARYLRDLFDLLGDWTLAVAGYNAGEYRVLRAMQQAHATDFWSVRSLLPKETAAYVPRVLAAIALAKRAGSAGSSPGNAGLAAFKPAQIE